MEEHAEATQEGLSWIEALPALAQTSDRFKSAFSDLLIAHIDDVVRLENQIKTLREQISEKNLDSLHSVDVHRGSDAFQPRVALQHPLQGHDAFATAGSRVKPRCSDHLTWEETVLRARQDALQNSRTRVLECRSGPRTSARSLLIEYSVSVGTVDLCTRLMTHPSFELFFGVLILSNSLFMGVHTEYESVHAGDSTWQAPWPLYAIRYFYTALFTVELFIRACANGFSKFLVGKSCGWNLLDTVVVLASWMEVVTDIMTFASRDSSSSGGIDVSNTRTMRILRVARLVRVLRVGRLLNFFRPLRILVFSIINTLKTVFWALLLLLIIIYVFSISFSQAVADHRRDNQGRTSDVDLDLYWGSLPKCMFTLFKTISGGLSWHECVHALSVLAWWWILVFIVYISSTTLAVMNVITGVFCQSAIEGTQNDRDIVTQKHLAMKHAYKQTIKDVFKDIDTDGSEQITLKEFEEHFQSEEARAFFASLEIEAVHAFEVFQLIDEGANALDFEDFVDGCLRLRGNARSLEIAKLEAMSKRLDKKVVRILKLLQELKVIGCFASFASSPAADLDESIPTEDRERHQMPQGQFLKAFSNDQYVANDLETI